ncbi:hypothetical protein ACIBHX_08760 [Nonomuraea sp. NPDC050536]|uniref:hypothetical protein n=1 Tax=Nonomuraea sp. NPDC050536 TaxID=3364366 RepID=UPI0037C93018
MSESLFGTRNRFFLAAALATYAAAVIRRPLAFSIAAGIGLTIADSDQMRAAKVPWKTKQNGGDTQEIDQLMNDVNKLKDDLKNKAHWEAGSFELVSGQIDEYIKQAKNMAGQRDVVGDNLDASAKHYDMVSWIALSIAGVMATLATLSLMGKINLAAAVATQAATNAGLQGLWERFKPLLMKVAVFAGATYGVYQLASLTSQQLAMKFQDMKIPTATFGATALGNDAKSGAVTPVAIKDPAMGGLPDLSAGTSLV